MQQVKNLDDVMLAKDADNRFSDWLRERMYGDNGYMTLQGRNAVEGRAQFEKDVEERRRDFGTGLTPGAARSYQDASQDGHDQRSKA